MKTNQWIGALGVALTVSTATSHATAAPPVCEDSHELLEMDDEERFEGELQSDDEDRPIVIVIKTQPPPPPPAVSAPSTSDSSSGETARTVGIGLLFGFGAASIVGGVTAAALFEDFYLRAGLSTAGFLAGSALLAAGFGVLYPDGPPAWLRAGQQATLTLSPRVGPASGGLLLAGVF
ncbi:MAG: hypothetical protein U0271_46065 [Polyangiaceae bacterium]